MFLIGQNRYFIISTFKVLKMEFNFEYTRWTKKVSSIFASLFHLKVKNNLIKSQAQFREKLRKLRLRQKDGFLIRKSCMLKIFSKPIMVMHACRDVWTGALKNSTSFSFEVQEQRRKRFHFLCFLFILLDELLLSFTTYKEHFSKSWLSKDEYEECSENNNLKPSLKTSYLNRKSCKTEEQPSLTIQSERSLKWESWTCLKSLFLY